MQIKIAAGVEQSDIGSRRIRVYAMCKRHGYHRAQPDLAGFVAAEHDQADYAGLGEKMKAIQAQQDEIEELELRWFELTEQIG